MGTTGPGPPASPEVSTCTAAARVEWIDTDAAGIYHNSTVVRFVEAAEAEFMRVRGVDGYFPSAPRVRYEVNFLSPLFFGQTSTTTVHLVRIGTSSMTWQFEVWGDEYEGRPRTLAANGKYVTVHVGAGNHSGRAGSTPWPSAWITALTGHVPEEPASSRQNERP